ncbi:fatty acid desaturase family protein [Novosphingobium aerophilum]|uniref:fatty acid desaturase family protein n=1 Tax=Novosphingobium TaxID=165696 RepID=UPI0012C23F31|nr:MULTISPECIES: fatty acid desaturase [unclassified Novosphingobium]MPS68505.1 fatty acid desaturase [Novosphingobium sp.]WRT93844.1 fatty acid desaturase [Novosphingobium sp. RL4]
MIAQEAIDLSPTAPREAAARPRSSEIPDDKAMLRAAVELTRDISAARPEIYWPDMLASAAVGYGALAGAILVDNTWAALGCGLLAALGLYRALLFIHELSHIHRDALPGFRFGWNLLVGIPLLTPSLMYENVHTIHHTRTRYGTVEDPEYLPLALMKPWSLPVFALTAILLPVALLIRSAVLVPLGAVIPPLRKLVWERASALAINPQFRRRPAEGKFARMVFWQEVGCSAWAIAVLAASAAYGWRPLLIALCVVSLTAFLNQVRTLVAHLWENDGDAMTVTAQYLDSVNVPPPAKFSELWAPVGLRYHALHHLLPSMPYHSLAEAHRRLARQLGTDSTYAKANYPGLMPLVGRLIQSTMRTR